MGSKSLSKSHGAILIYAIVLVPPTIFTLFNPDLFLQALGLVGGFADVILLGVLPVLIVWNGRYVKQIKSPYTVAGGKLFLSALLLFSLGILLLRH